MWGLFSRFQALKSSARFARSGPGLVKSRLFNSRILPAVFATASASLVLGGALIVNDASNRSLGGIDVDSAIDPFEKSLTSKELPFLATDHKLIASGVRSVTFLGFKVYGVGLYISAKDEPKLKSLVKELLKAHPEMTVQSLLDDKKLSQELIDKISQVVPYAVRITTIRNTDFGHLKDGLTKSLLASPMAKEHREDVAKGIEQLRDVFLAFRGSFPKNRNLWLVSDTHNIRLHNTIKVIEDMGILSESILSRVFLVSYLSNLQPLSEPLRKNFVSYVNQLIN